jgi:circadian clock protein KaiB
MSVRLQLFVAGRTVRSTNAHSALVTLCDQAWPDDYELEVIDVIDRPDLADAARVLATPMVLKAVPPPERRVVGDLSDLERLGRALDAPLRGGSSANGGRP